jgi:hypothetical protein
MSALFICIGTHVCSPTISCDNLDPGETLLYSKVIVVAQQCYKLSSERIVPTYTFKLFELNTLLQAWQTLVRNDTQIYPFCYILTLCLSTGFFKGTSADQDRRFSDKELKLLKSMKFPPEFEKKVVV